MGEVVKLSDIAASTTTRDRARMVAAYMRAKNPLNEPILKITTLREALAYGDQWQAYAHRMEVMLALATAQRDSSDLLLEIALEDLARIRGV